MVSPVCGQPAFNNTDTNFIFVVEDAEENKIRICRKRRILQIKPESSALRLSLFSGAYTAPSPSPTS
jgi:hypothetical protein